MLDWIKSSVTDAICPECPVCPTLQEQLWQLFEENVNYAGDTLSEIPWYGYVTAGVGILSVGLWAISKFKGSNSEWPIHDSNQYDNPKQKSTHQSLITDYYIEKNQSRITDFFSSPSNKRG